MSFKCQMIQVLLSIAALLSLAHASGNHAPRLVDFQVGQPPPLPKDTKQCTFQVLKHTFGNSYGSPAIVQYTPPSGCGPASSWTGISLNFTVTSNGTQYDRLGTFTFHEVEIWRTSTPEPIKGDGIVWTQLKDVTRYIPLFAKSGTFILELDNVVTTGLDGLYASKFFATLPTLHATVYASSTDHPPAKQANTIIPIATLANNTGAQASIPPQLTTTVTLPQNTIEVYAELYASGNAEEEFWYYNIADEYLDDLPPKATYGRGPFRELRMLVDDKVAGVALPYPVIFTGGIIPTAWRPITSYGALDLPTYFLDLTPFVPILADGKSHNISIDVVSAESNHTINDNWFVSGNLQVVTDSSSKPTTGEITKYIADPFAVSTVTGNVGKNGDVDVTVKAYRNIHIESTINSGSGKSTKVVWTQNLSYQNSQSYLRNTTIQNVAQIAFGSMLSTHNGVKTVSDEFSYPLNINFTILTPNGSSFSASFDHSYNRDLAPSPLILGSTIKEHQLASGYFAIRDTGNIGTGTSNNTFSYSDPAGNTYNREVRAALNEITYDHQSGTLSSEPEPLLSTFTATNLKGGRVRLPRGAQFRLLDF